MLIKISLFFKSNILDVIHLFVTGYFCNGNPEGEATDQVTLSLYYYKQVIQNFYQPGNIDYCYIANYLSFII